MPGFEGDGGPATNARLSSPSGVAVDAVGNLYIADTGNQKIRKVDGASGTITTIAAYFPQPTGLAVDGTGTLYIADPASHRIFKLDTAGAVTTVAGSGSWGFGGDGGPATDAKLHGPWA